MRNYHFNSLWLLHCLPFFHSLLLHSNWCMPFVIIIAMRFHFMFFLYKFLHDAEKSWLRVFFLHMNVLDIISTILLPVYWKNRGFTIFTRFMLELSIVNHKNGTDRSISIYDMIQNSKWSFHVFEIWTAFLFRKLYKLIFFICW